MCFHGCREMGGVGSSDSKPSCSGLEIAASAVWNLLWKGVAARGQKPTPGSRPSVPVRRGGGGLRGEVLHSPSAGFHAPARLDVCARGRRGAFSAREAGGMTSESPRGLKECHLVRKEVAEKNRQPARLEQQHVSKAFISTGLGFAPTASITHNPPRSRPIGLSSHLGSLQHFPFVQDLHGKNFVSVSHFHNSDLKGGERQGHGERVGNGRQRMRSTLTTGEKQLKNLSLEQQECKMMNGVQRCLVENEQLSNLAEKNRSKTMPRDWQSAENW